MPRGHDMAARSDDRQRRALQAQKPLRFVVPVGTLTVTLEHRLGLQGMPIVAYDNEGTFRLRTFRQVDYTTINTVDLIFTVATTAVETVILIYR